MSVYKAPVRDIRFVTQDLLDFDRHYESLPGCDDANQELIDTILSEISKFAEDVIAPLNSVGDTVGCKLDDDGEVKTPPGFKEAYEQYVEGGWPTLDQPAEYGGQDLPMSIGLPIREMNGTANWSWAMYPGLSHGAMETIDEHGSDEQKRIFMEPLVSGRWTGTMCLTEAHCGTDLGLLRTRADQAEDGTYRITGSKVDAFNLGLGGQHADVLAQGAASNLFCQKCANPVGHLVILGLIPRLAFQHLENMKAVATLDRFWG